MQAGFCDPGDRAWRRLDVTNVVEHPVLTVITSISMDHMQYLGIPSKRSQGRKPGFETRGSGGL